MVVHIDYTNYNNDLEDVNARIDTITFGNKISLTGYTSSWYNIPNDGYLVLSTSGTAGDKAFASINNVLVMMASTDSPYYYAGQSLFVRKGMSVKLMPDYCGGTYALDYYPLAY